LLYAGNNLDKARRIFERTTKDPPRIRLTSEHGCSISTHRPVARDVVLTPRASGALIGGHEWRSHARAEAHQGRATPTADGRAGRLSWRDHTLRAWRGGRMTPSSGGAIGAPGGKTANIARLPELLRR
jgi:hypothetical protein